MYVTDYVMVFFSYFSGDVEKESSKTSFAVGRTVMDFER